MTPVPDRYEEAAEVLPCKHSGCGETRDGWDYHGDACPASKRPAVARLLRSECERVERETTEREAARWREALAALGGPLRPPEIQSGLTRMRWAELLIRQLPESHDGRNSWLLNWGGDASPSAAVEEKEGEPQPDRRDDDGSPDA